MVFTFKTFLFLSAKLNFTLILYFCAFFSKKSKIVDYFLFSLFLNKKDFDKSSFFEYSNFFTEKENDLDAMCHGFYTSCIHGFCKVTMNFVNQWMIVCCEIDISKLNSNASEGLRGIVGGEIAWSRQLYINRHLQTERTQVPSTTAPATPS